MMVEVKFTYWIYPDALSSGFIWKSDTGKIDIKRICKTGKSNDLYLLLQQSYLTKTIQKAYPDSWRVCNAVIFVAYV